MLASAEDEQIEECDATASPNNETESVASDYDATPNCTKVHLVGLLVDLNVVSKFSDERRLDIFKRYWSLGDISAQRNLILCSMESTTPKYKYPAFRE